MATIKDKIESVIQKVHDGNLQDANKDLKLILEAKLKLKRMKVLKDENNFKF